MNNAGFQPLGFPGCHDPASWAGLVQLRAFCAALVHIAPVTAQVEVGDDWDV
jgi:hypothetical protein